MSYREVRSFVEVLKALGYPRLISMDSFRLPNFELVADCLHWLFQRFDPGNTLSDDITTESDRVLFLQSVAQSMLVKARIKLNIKRLYAADALAVKDLLKMATLLYKATHSKTDMDEERQVQHNSQMQELLERWAARSHRQELQCLMLCKESQNSERLGIGNHVRLLCRAVARNMDSETMETSIREATAAVRENISSLERSLLDLEDYSRSLDGKIEKRRAELKRAETRLSSLAAVRPAYMDELEGLQADLQQLFAVYLQKHRNLEYLEGQLEAHRLAQRNKMEMADRTMKHMQKRLRDNELRILRGEQEVDESQVDNDSADASPLSSEASFVQRARQPAAGFVSLSQPAQAQPTDRGGKVTGNLTGLLSDDDSSDHSIIDDTGSESTHISEGITDDGQLFEDNGIGADLSDLSDALSDDQSDVSNF